jgi:hypothetical protein
MRRTLCFSLLLAGAALCVFAQSGVLSEFSGTVELKTVKSNSFVPAKTGDVVAADTIVSTGFRSTAVIQVGSSTIAVRPLTRLSLAEIRSESDSETLNVNLQTGRVRVDVKPPAGTRANTTVQSPSATASVRGTSFEFDVTNLRVYEGTVALQGSNGITVPVSAGAISYVDSNGEVVDPVDASRQALLPPAPVGSGSSGKAASSSAPSASPSSPSSDTGTIEITIQGSN